MNADRLLELYEQISEAPDAIVRLRRFVLDLAVRGKLVEQDAKEKYAMSLLLKAKAIKEAEGVKHKANPILANDIPFRAPNNWVWTRVGEIALQTGSGSTPRGGKSAYTEKGTPFLRSQNVYDDGLRLGDVVYINDATNEKMKRTQVKSKDLLLNITGGSIGRCCLIPDNFDGANVSQHVAIIRTAARGTEDYLHLLVRAPFFQEYVMGEQTGAGREGLPKNRMDRIPVPLPPLAEQHRIVAKVDELMALCDRLEEARKTREETRDKLTAASLARLTAPETTPEDFPAHVSFALETLPTITSGPDQIKTLRQTILNLAVRGKLVEQDTADETVAVTLDQIYQARDQLVSSKKLKKSKPTTNPISYRDEYPTPVGWSWASFGELFFVTKLAGFEYTKYFGLTDEGEVPVIRAQNVRPWHASLKNLKYISSDVSHALERSALTKDCLLVTFIGAGIGDVAHFKPERRWHLAPNVAKAEPFEGCEALYCLKYQTHFINSPMGRRELFKHMKMGAQPSLSMGTIRDVDIPIPPLAEQHRIVAKVDTLMAICDRLEAALTTSNATRTRLLEVLLNEALESPEKALEATE